MSTIADRSIVVMNFKMSLADGQIVKNTYEEKPVKFTMGDGSFSEVFENAMRGLGVGDHKKIVLAPNDAFGEVNPDNIYHLPRQRFSPDWQLEKDMAIAFDYTADNEMVGIVREFDAAFVTVDFNHPLSGREITFDVEIMEVQVPASV